MRVVLITTSWWELTQTYYNLTVFWVCFFLPSPLYGEDVSLMNEFASGDRGQDGGRRWDTRALTRSWGYLLIGSIQGDSSLLSTP